MRVFALCLSLVACASLRAQSFDCAPIGPLPGNPSLNCEGVCANALVAATGVSATVSCGFPTAGTQYLNVRANGPIPTLPSGGPVPRPLSATVSEVRLPIPTGATTISFSWEFFNAEGANSTSFNDGMSVDVVGPTGTLVANLVYADTWSGTLTGGCAAGGTETGPAGPQTYTAALPVYSPCDYISIAVWNAGDNAVQSGAYFDAFTFDSVLAGCPPPCIAVSPTPTLAWSSPLGLGSLQVNMAGLPVGGGYFLAVTLYAGAYPNGWLYGLDIPLSELSYLINFGYPFSGGADLCGGASLGPFTGLPSGLQLYAMAFGVPAASVSPSGHSPATTYVVP